MHDILLTARARASGTGGGAHERRRGRPDPDDSHSLSYLVYWTNRSVRATVTRCAVSFDQERLPCARGSLNRVPGSDLGGYPSLGSSPGPYPPVVADDPNWYPTGSVIQMPFKPINVVTLLPLAGSPDCLSCHATAESESTFASMDNILGRELRYRAFDVPPAAAPTPTSKRA